jgi:hypothetical protein
MAAVAPIGLNRKTGVTHADLTALQSFDEFSGIKKWVSFSTPIRPYPQLVSMKSNASFLSISYS